MSEIRRYAFELGKRAAEKSTKIKGTEVRIISLETLAILSQEILDEIENDRALSTSSLNSK